MRSLRRPLAALAAAALTLPVLLAPGGDPPTQFGDPLPGLDAGSLARFNAGLAAFQVDETATQGLGPVFNDTSCVNCHGGPAPGGSNDTTETRFGRVVNGQFDPMTEFGGPLIQVQGIGLYNGVDFVGEVVPPQATIVAKRRTTPLFGLGLVGALPDSALHQLAAAEEEHTPATAGRVNTIIDPTTGAPIAGRFGWKCQHGSLVSFAADAYLNEMGITTPLQPNENCPQGNCALLAANPAASNPNEPDNNDVLAFADFMTFLAPPPQLPLGAQARSGARTFATIGCANCHTPSLQTGPNSVAALDRVEFNPYSDFLLHDMGHLGDGITQSGAGPTEMRTAPLWGARARTSFLHDGRAKSLAAAIAAHDGQGRAARDRFARLSPGDQANLIAFLNAL
jgi:CxxC motif-containing protein (DUF1111 family)